jgi:hypothetical protein
MRVAAVAIGDGLGITLCSDDGGPWRFSSWHRNAVQITDALPTLADRERSFVTVEEAGEYFRHHYGKLFQVTP